MRKNLLWISLIVLLILSGLSVNTIRVSAAEYPAIYIEPASTVNPSLTPGSNYTISIKTNYTGNDITCYQFTLKYNPLVLHGVKVTNETLIPVGWAENRSPWDHDWVEYPEYRNTAEGKFTPGTFDNNAGELSLTVGFFICDYLPMPVVSGPGTLANVTFTVVGIGALNITLGPETKLIGYTDVKVDVDILGNELYGGWGTNYEIVSDVTGLMVRGYFINVQNIHDVAVRSVEAPSTAIVEQPVPIQVTVGNEGNETESVTVTTKYDTTVINTTDFNLASGLFKTVSFSWNTAGLGAATYTINATATITADQDLSDNNKTKQITLELVHDVAVVSLEAPYYNGVGGNVPIEVTVANEGSHTESVTVTVYRDTTQIDTDSFTLNKGPTSQIVNFTWNTMGLSTGEYTINATATITETDQDLSDNNKTILVKLVPGDVTVTSVVPAEGISHTDTWTGDGTTTFGLTKGPVVQDSEEVRVNGTIMRKPENYTIDYAAGTITFTTAPGDGAEIKVTYLYSHVYTKWTIGIAVTVKNLGLTTANCTVTVYANISSWQKIGSLLNVIIPAGSPKTVTVNCALSGVPYHNHAIKANATLIVPTVETNSTNNEFVDGQVFVKMPGDANGDGWVDGIDLVMYLAPAFNSHGPDIPTSGAPASVNWNLQCDFNGDGWVDGIDLVMYLAPNFNKSY